MRRLYSLLFLLYSLVAVAQKEDYNWVISDPFIVRFNNDTIVGVDTFNIQPNRVLINTSYTCNDSDGNLLFYTDGVSIYDKTGAIMQGCDTFLSPSSYTSGLNGIGGGSSQGIVGFRKPRSANEYYVFYATSGDCNGPFVTDAPCVFFMISLT